MNEEIQIEKILNTPGFAREFTFGSVQFKGLLGFMLVSLDGFQSASFEAQAQRFSMVTPTYQIIETGLTEGSAFYTEQNGVRYHFSVSRFFDLLDGWTKLNLDFVSREIV